MKKYIYIEIVYILLVIYILTYQVNRKAYGDAAKPFPGVMVTLAPQKVKEMRAAVDMLHKAKGMVDIQTVQKLAGQLSWASGLFPWIKGFNSALWAAITAHTSEQEKYSLKQEKYSLKKRPTQLFFVLRIAQAIAWIRMLLAGVIRDAGGNALVVQKWTSAATRLPTLTMCVRSDASPFGFGAILFRNGSPVAWVAEEWSALDYALFKGSKRGDPAWQAEWELLAVLIAVDTWLPRLRCQAMCLVQTDATAALHDVARMAGRTPAMNALSAELALRFESAQVHFWAEHLNGTLNFECDALSRLSQGAAIPGILRRVPQAKTRPRSADFFWAWPRALLQSAPKVQ